MRKAFLCPLKCAHNGRVGVSNHQCIDCILNRLFRRRSKKASKFRDNGLCEGNSPVTGEFPLQRASNAEMYPFDDVIMSWHPLELSPLTGKPAIYAQSSSWYCHLMILFLDMGITSNGSWCIGIKGEMSGTVCVTFTWDIYIYIYIYELFIAFVVLLFVHYCNVMVYVVYCVASGKQEKVQACLVTLWLFIISCHSLYKTTLGSLCSWKPAWSLKKRPHSMCLKPFVKMCIFVVIQIFWSLR